MKNIALLLFLSFLLNSTIAQESSHCNVNPMLHQYYDLDVKDATLRWAFECDTNYRTSSAAIPEMLEDSIWGALAAVFNVQNMPERDSAIDMYCIHQFPKNHLVDEIILSVDHENPLIISWLNHDPGYPILDSILTKYGFISYDKERMRPYILLRTEQKINVYYVLHLLKLVDGIIYADPNLTFGDGNGFDYRSSGTDRFLYFDKAWGDCMAGCYAHHIWQFKIDENCGVEYMGTLRHYPDDESMGEPWNCNITGLIDQKNVRGLTIYPNPANDIVYLKGSFPGSIKFQILNTQGQIVLDGEIPNNGSINISEIDNGIYYIQLLGDAHYDRSSTFIKL